ncbi:MAG: DUF4900 domain-containing protein [Candidatus Eisenbacteria bacterium]|nr:DUF4900 domain-containing protein [Candidatus Eisenbacteria bacterium]
MQRVRSVLGNEDGATLGVVMILAIVMLISIMTLFEMGSQDASLAVRDGRVAQAFFLAESGAERARAWLGAQTSIPTGEFYPFGGGADTLDPGTYMVTVDSDHSGVRPIYTIHSTGSVGKHSRSIEIDVMQSSVTDYLYFTNRDVGPIGTPWFRTGDVIDGPIHTNGQLAIWGDPVFTDDVQCSETTIVYNNDGDFLETSASSNPPHDEPDFQGDLRLGAAEIEWFDQGAVTTLKDLAGLTLNGGHEVMFGRDDGSGPMLGYLSYRKNKDWTDVEISSFNGIVYVNGDCMLSGTLDGQVTIVSNGSIEIIDDIIYADSDENGPCEGCDDVLGMVAGSKVEVADTEANCDDCVIHSHLIAVNNQSCLVAQYAQGDPRGTLTVYGGLGQDKWGPVGTGVWVDGEFIVLTGYERDFHYDWRLRDILPPGYEHIVFETSGYVRIAWRDVS